MYDGVVQQRWCGPVAWGGGGVQSGIATRQWGELRVSNHTHNPKIRPCNSASCPKKKDLSFHNPLAHNRVHRRSASPLAALSTTSRHNSHMCTDTSARAGNGVTARRR